MFKKSIFTLMLVAAMSYVSAQSLQFELNGQVFEEGEMVYCTELNPDFGEYIQDMQIRNISGTELNVVIEREIIDVPDDGIVYFCWGMCFSPDVNVSPAVTMAAGELSGAGMLGFHYMPGAENVAAFVKYSAYDERNTEERVSIIIAYNTAESVAERPSGNLSHAYPNPASSVVRFNYNLSSSDNATLKVYNLVGQEVMHRQLNGVQGQISFSVADLNEGIYFCNLVVNGQALKTEKFIVRK